MKLGKRLQVFKDNRWQYVFCYNRQYGIIVTDNPLKALKERDLSYFQSKYSNYAFRVI